MQEEWCKDNIAYPKIMLLDDKKTTKKFNKTLKKILQS